LLATSSAHGFSALDPATGKSLWELPVFKQRVVGSPLVACGLVFGTAGSGGSGKQMFAVRPADPAKKVEAAVAYELKESLPYVPIFVSDGRRVYLLGDQGVMTCIQPSDGKVLWRERIGGTYFASPVLVDGRLYCASREGRMVVVAAADQYKLLATVDLEEPTNATPAVAGGVMYIRTLSHLMAIGGRPSKR